jgi:hypothetical protein
VTGSDSSPGKQRKRRAPYTSWNSDVALPAYLCALAPHFRSPGQEKAKCINTRVVLSGPPAPSERTSLLFLFCYLLCSRFVPFLYLTPAAQAVPAFWSDLEISKLRVSSSRSGFESHPLRHSRYCLVFRDLGVYRGPIQRPCGIGTERIPSMSKPGNGYGHNLPLNCRWKIIPFRSDISRFSRGTVNRLSRGRVMNRTFTEPNLSVYKIEQSSTPETATLTS